MNVQLNCALIGAITAVRGWPLALTDVLAVLVAELVAALAIE
jgi:hypothetical protein